jgi:hypothetical protein
MKLLGANNLLSSAVWIVPVSGSNRHIAIAVPTCMILTDAVDVAVMANKASSNFLGMA